MKSQGLLAAASLTVLVASLSAADAQQKTFYVAGYGGSFEKTMRDEVIPDFEKKHGVKVEYIAGNSTDTLAKLQAQKGNQQIDIAIVDDGPMYQAIQLGFCGKMQTCRPPICTTPPASRTTRPSPSGWSRPASCTTPRSSPRRLGRADLLERPEGCQVPETGRSSRRSTIPTGSIPSSCTPR